MLIKKASDIRSSEITDENVYLNRRSFVKAAVLAGTAAGTALLYRRLNPPPVQVPEGAKIATANVADDATKSGFVVNEKLTSLQDITIYNNFYEFSTSKG